MTAARVVTATAALKIVVSAAAGAAAARSSAASATVGASAQHTEICGHNFKAGALLALFVLPFAGLDAAFDKDKRTFFQVLLGDFSLFTPYDNFVPFGTFLAFTVFVFVGFVRGHGKIGNGLATAGEARLWIAAETADQNDFIYRHRKFSPCDGDDSRKTSEAQKAARKGKH